MSKWTTLRNVARKVWLKVEMPKELKVELACALAAVEYENITGTKLNLKVSLGPLTTISKCDKVYLSRLHEMERFLFCQNALRSYQATARCDLDNRRV